MNILSALRHVLLGGLAGLLLTPVAGAAALEAVYEGNLVPESFEAPFPITVEVRDLQGIVVGQIRTGPPHSGSAPIATGEYEGGRCNLRAPIAPGTTIRLTGTCHPRLFEGRYTLTSGRKEENSSGTFRLLPKAAPGATDEDGAGRRAIGAPPAKSLTECINANARCLTGCPQGDYNTEFLCANRCRQRHQACKGKASAPATLRSAPAESGER